jgi:O-antigen/teichoic acid export membrane protein
VSSSEKQVRNSFLYLFPLITTNILPFITIPIFTRILSIEDYGALALTQVYAIFIGSLSNFNMSLVYDRNFFQYRDNCKHTGQLLYTVLTVVTGNFLILIFITFIFRNYLSNFVIGAPGFGNMILIACLVEFIRNQNHFFLAFLKNSEMAEKFVRYSVAASLITFSLSFFLVAYLRIGIMGLLYSQLFSGIFIWSIMAPKFFLKFPFSLSRSILVDALKLSYPLTPRLFLGFLGTQFDKFIVGHLASIGGAGIYSIGQRVSYLVFAYMTAIQNVFGPQVYKRMFDEKRKGIGVYLTPFFYVTTLVALMVAFFAEEIISILTPVSYHGAIYIVSILSMYYGSMFFGKITGQQLLFAKKTYISSIMGTLSIGISVGMSYFFAMKWGAIGVAWGLFLTGLITGTMGFVVGQYCYRIDWECKWMGGILVFFLGSSLLLVLMMNMQVDYFIRLAVKIIFVLLYGFLGVRIGLFRSENLSMIKKSLGFPLTKLAKQTNG